MRSLTYYCILLMCIIFLFGCGTTIKESGINNPNDDPNPIGQSIVITKVTPDNAIISNQHDFYYNLPEVNIGSTINLAVSANELDGLTLNYKWIGTGSFSSTEDCSAIWTAPNEQGLFYPKLSVSNGVIIQNVMMVIKVVDPVDNVAPATPDNVVIQRDDGLLKISWDYVADNDVMYYEVHIKADSMKGIQVPNDQNYCYIDIDKYLSGRLGYEGYQDKVISISVTAYDYADNVGLADYKPFTLTANYLPVEPYMALSATLNSCELVSYFSDSDSSVTYVTPDTVELYIEDQLVRTLTSTLYSSNRYYFNVTMDTSGYEANKLYRFKYVAKKESSIIHEQYYVSYLNKSNYIPESKYIKLSRKTLIDEYHNYQLSSVGSKNKYSLQVLGFIYDNNASMVCSSSILTTPTGSTFNVGTNSSTFAGLWNLPDSRFAPGEYRIDCYQGDTVAISKTFDMSLLVGDRIYDVEVSDDDINIGESLSITWKKSGNTLKYFWVYLDNEEFAGDIDMGHYDVLTSDTQITIPGKLIKYPGRYRVIIKGYENLEAYYNYSAYTDHSNFYLKTDKYIDVR